MTPAPRRSSGSCITDNMSRFFVRRLFTDGNEYRNQVVTLDGSLRSVVSVTPCDAAPEGLQAFECMSAGFFDIHINGGRRFHFTERPEEASIEDIYRTSFETGTAYVLPTLVTSSWDNILRGIRSMKTYRQTHPESGVLGMHLEGPFLHPLRRGAHLESLLAAPAAPKIRELIEAGGDALRLITVAPEIFTPGELQLLLDSGIVVAAGHSNATYAEAMAAFDQGIRLVTHLYNAMSPMGHRSPGLVGAVFDSPEVYAPVIVDGIHCDYAAARIAYKIKQDKMFLISDALFLMGEVKEFHWGEFDACLVNGEYRNSEGNLAGGAISLGEAVRNAVVRVGIPLAEAIDMATQRPALAMGLGGRIGKVAPGYPAVFTCFDDSLTWFKVFRPSLEA